MTRQTEAAIMEMPETELHAVLLQLADGAHGQEAAHAAIMEIGAVRALMGG